MDKVEQALFFPETMLDELKAEAVRHDRSLSWCAQKAWVLSRALVTAQRGLADDDATDVPALPPTPERHVASAKRKQTLYFPSDMLAELVSTSERLDRSLSWCLQKAWIAAYDEIRALPVAASPEG